MGENASDTKDLKSQSSRFDYPLMIITLIIVVILAVIIAMNGETAPTVINSVLLKLYDSPIGDSILLFTLICLGWTLMIAFSKYGRIRLGHGKPEYTNFQYIAMNICAGLGATALIYSFIEWTFYYATPALGMEPYSQEAMEWATAYNVFHWGPNMWATNTMAAIPVAYAYYVRKVPSLRISAVAGAMLSGKSYAKVCSKLVDYLMAICTCGGLSVTLGLGVPLVANGLGKIFGFTPTYGTNVLCCILVAGLYTLSSWVGLSKGMKVISSLNLYLAIAMIVVLVITGPTTFIFDNLINSTGIMLNHFVEMSLWTAPMTGNTFPQDWTIFYWCFGWCFASLVSIFMAQISRGRRLREMIFCLNFGGAGGCLLFFGLNGGYSMHMQLTGKMDVTGLVQSAGTAEAVTSIMQNSGFGVIGLVLFVVITWLFTATTLDSAAFALSSASTRHLKEGENTAPILRLYWCIVLAVLPMALIYINAPLSSLQTLVVILTTPFIVIYGLMVGKTMKWMKEDYPRMIDGRLPEDMTNEEIEQAVADGFEVPEELLAKLDSTAKGGA